MYKDEDEFKNKYGIDRHKFLTLWALGMSDAELAISFELSSEKIQEIKNELNQNRH
ncbi:hypothetical protein [Selenihalanaerobacter shriftii]|uniref:Uncharacterized protein n=1 Tax=Selenihalanaerobacter shriftii TaxID=142842 RepID=A0A1T4NA77_9FIRM|nr:hypothetical protein [Selenihalanaerobacter shriftii]SJZ76015.1 hypothetical protein SAMN02745118_01752 [Selenihalanaerobacter shriftii]